MPVYKVLAKDWKVQIDTDPLEQAPTGTPNWVEIKGLATIGFAGTKTDADTTTFDDGGWESHLPATRGRTLTLEGRYLEDKATKERDPGQEAVEKYDEKTGVEGLGRFRLISPAGIIREFSASVNVGNIGGGNNDSTAWSAEIRISGPVTYPTS